MKPNDALGIVLKSRGGGVESEPVPKSVLRQVVGKPTWYSHLFSTSTMFCLYAAVFLVVMLLFIAG